MTTFQLSPRTRTCDIYVDGVHVVSVFTSAPAAYREQVLAQFGREAAKPETRAQARRREAAEWGRTGGYGKTRSGR